MIVVADSSPLIYLSVLGKLELLRALYGTVLVPRAVFDEVVVAGDGVDDRAGRREATAAGLRIHGRRACLPKHRSTHCPRRSRTSVCSRWRRSCAQGADGVPPLAGERTGGEPGPVADGGRAGSPGRCSLMERGEIGKLADVEAGGVVKRTAPPPRQRVGVDLLRPGRAGTGDPVRSSATVNPPS